MSLATDDRAVSPAFSYVLTVGITTVLVAGLVIASTGALESQRERAIHAELDAVGERLATEIATVDHVADETDSRITIDTHHPARVADAGYGVELRAGGCESGGGPCLVLEARGTDVEREVPLRPDVDVSGSSAPGGSVRIVHDGETVSIATTNHD